MFSTPPRARGESIRTQLSDAPRRLWAVYAVLGVVLLGYFASLILRGFGESTKFIDGWLVAVFELVLSALCLARAFGPRQGRAIPLILGCGLLSWSLGDIVLTTESSGGATRRLHRSRTSSTWVSTLSCTWRSSS